MRLIIGLVFFLVAVSCNSENKKANDSKENAEFFQLETIEEAIFRQSLDALSLIHI